MIKWLFGNNEIKIEFPSHLKTDNAGFDFFSQLFYETKFRKTFILDFKNVEWIEANLCAIFGAIIINNRKYGANFKFHNLHNVYLNNTLKNNGFLELIEKAPISNHDHSGVPFKEFDLKNEIEVERYIYKYVLRGDRVPNMSAGAKRKIFRSIFEIYQNSVMHSGAENVYVCGQLYKNRGRMALTMVEIGRTFKENVNSHSPDFSNYNGIQSIEWAVKSGNTTKKKTETGGLGLDLIRDFLKMNGGKLQIKSAKGYWEEKKGINFVLESTHHFKGSIVNIEFNLYDKNSYISREELDVKSIL